MMRRLPGWLVCLLLGATCWVAGSQTSSHADAYPVTIEGSGDSDFLAEMTSWQNAVYGAAQPTDLAYYQRGTIDGRAQLLRGDTDFAISGVPFTAAELAARPQGAGRIIEVPLAVASTSIVFSTPTGGWSTFRVRTEDPDCADLDFLPDPEVCIERGVYSGQLNIPAENLAAMMVGLSPTFQQNGLAAWPHPAFAQAFGTNTLSVMGRAGLQHTYVGRTESSAVNKYSQLYAATLGPTAWALRIAENPQFDWASIGETMSPRTLSRYGAETQIGVMAIRLNPASNSVTDLWTGNAGPVPTTYVPRYLKEAPAMGFRVAAVQNANGDYVLPTTASITAAVSAGTDPIYAATHKVKNAYPLVWIDHLYTVAGTLTPDQANALAATIRFVVTDGQDDIVADGSAALPSDLVATALARANEIITSNCPSNGYVVTTGGPSSFEPTTPKVSALTGLKHCAVAPPPTTTTVPETTTTTTTTVAPTTTVAATTTTAGSTPATATSTTTGTEVASLPGVPDASTEYTPYLPSYSPPVNTSPYIIVPQDTTSIPTDDSLAPTTTSESTTTTVPEAATTTSAPAPVGGGAGTRVRGRSLSTLPLPLPTDGTGGFKKLGTLFLGASGFLGLRRMVSRRRAVS